MAKYYYKKGHELTRVSFRKGGYTLGDCSQKQLKELYDLGYPLVQKEEEKPKKESKKAEDKKSVDEGQGE
jgi:hypothetical protein